MKTRSKSLLLAILFQFPLLVVAQSVFSGTIIDTKKNPIPFAHIQLVGTGQGTIANGEGEFQLVIPENSGSRTIAISSIGFVPREILLRNKHETIMLQEDIIELSQVTIVPRDYARELVEKAIENIPLNYPNEEERLRGFLREKVYWKNEGEDNPLYVAESVIESIKKSYQQSSNKGDVTLIEGRKYESLGIDTLTTRIMAGAHHAHRFDATAQRSEFLKNPSSYEFEIQDTIRLNNKNLYKVNFLHKKGNPKGNVFIVDSTFAIAKTNFFYNQNFPPSYRGSGRQNLKYEVSYFEGYDKKWRLERTEYITEFSKQGATLVLTSEQVITNYEPNKNEISYLDKIQYRDIVLEKTGEYDSSFWTNYNILLPDAQTEMLFKRPPPPKSEIGLETEKTKAQKILSFITRLRGSYSLRYTPLQINNHNISYSNTQFSINESSPTETNYAFSLSSLFEYRIANNLFIGFESTAPIDKHFNNSTFDLHIIKEFNINPKGRPILLSPKMAFGYQQISKKLGSFKSDNSYKVNGEEFDSGETNILLQQRGFRFSPSLSLGIEKSNRLQFFIQGAYNLQINQRVGLFFDETDQFFLKQKRTFLKNGEEGLVIDFKDDLFENKFSISCGVYLSF